jgi:hypothetical protein
MNSSSRDSQKILCAHCHSLNVRRSKWASPAEKSAHLEGSPYRCLDCDKRFIGPKELIASMQKKPALSSARSAMAVGSLVGGVLILFFILLNSAERSIDQSAPVSAQ